jgi:hypothetical protein
MTDETQTPEPEDSSAFTEFVLSLAQSAAIDLGAAPHPETHAVAQDLPQAQHTIEILAMLEEKTRGNLTPNERKMLGGALSQLRLSYLDAKKRAGSSAT